MYELNESAIQDAAYSCAAQLAEHGFAEYILMPGDAAAYPFVVLPAGRVVDATGDSILKKDYRVILAANFGASYDWAGLDGMHWTYCAEKWAIDGHEATGRVVAAFLEALSAALKVDA